MGNAALKMQYAYAEETVSAEVTSLSPEVTRLRIATECQAACSLSGNKHGPDLDLFEERFGTSFSFA